MIRALCNRGIAALSVAIALAVSLNGSDMASGAALTVGPHGAYATILQALGNVVVGSDNQIWVESGYTYIEELLIPASFTSGSIALTGGWDSTFTIWNIDPQGTIIEAFPLGRPLEIRLAGGTFTLNSMTIRNGTGDDGGGVLISPSGDSTVVLRHCRVEGNQATDPGQANGGGVAAYLDGNERLEMSDVRLHDNHVISTAGAQARGGGLFVNASGNSTFALEDLELDLNSVESDGGALMGGGLYLSLGGTAGGQLLYGYPFDNGAVGSNGYGSAVVVYTSQSASLEIRGLGVALNHSTTDPIPQLWVSSSGQSSFKLTDSGLAQGDYTAGSIFSSDDAVVNLVNLTIADQPANGLYLSQSDASTLSVYNSIVFNSGPNLTILGSVDQGFNLVGVDPLFSNPAVLDYRLRPGSAALDSGTNSPPGDLGPTDFNGDPRILNGTVDIGMYEGVALEIFSDGFESGNTEDWSSSQGE